MANLSIGVYVHAEPERLKATLASLCVHTRQEHDLLLLADGPDEETAAALLTMSEIAQSNTSEPKGTAACFNRLLSHNAASILILLESGTEVAPGWLDALLVATQMPGLHFAPGQNRPEQHERDDDGAQDSDGRDRHVVLLLSSR